MVEFGISQFNWLYPILVLPIAACESITSSTHKTFPDSVRNYAEVIQYPNGVDSVGELQRSRRYIPIDVLKSNGRVGFLRRGTRLRAFLICASLIVAYRVPKPIG